NLDENLVNFADKQISRTTTAREELINSLKRRKKNITAFSNYLKFKLECIKQDPYPKHVHGLVTGFRFPIFFFPDKRYFDYKKIIAKHLGQHFSKEEELKNSINIKKYKELQEKCEYKWLLSLDEFNTYMKLIEKHFSKQEMKDLFNHIKQTLKENNIEIRFTNEKKDYQFLVTNNTVQFQLRNKPMFIGMVIADEETRTAYEEMFMNMWKDSKKL
ncbi:hypothetical protein KY312_01265, partial [Candidatus Woesearchaeota archaeon]|nr:hypothetical protein [Candidatus Woesearchaeota archaeon]